MTREVTGRKSHYCIVIADDHGPEWMSHESTDPRPAPVQYGSLGGSASLLHLALHRAATVAPTSQILVTLLEEHRHLWESILWCIRPEMRYVGDKQTSALLTSAAAILSIARVSPSSIVTILPARCHVRHEWTLRQAMGHATSELRHAPEGVVALGMLDIDEGVDEDYLVLTRASVGSGYHVQGMAQRPTPWVGRHLRRQGAAVFSGIMIGYAGTLAAHIQKHWPGISEKLSTLAAMARAAQREFEVPNSLRQSVSGAVLRALRWRPPGLSQRVFTVCDSGWSGLKSPQAVMRIAEFVTNRLDQERLGTIPRQMSVPSEHAAI